MISGSALLGADFRKGEWPSDVYYGGVGSVSNYLVTVGPVLTLTVALFTRRHSSKWLALFGLVFVAVALVSAQGALWPALGLQAALVCVWLWQVRAVAVGPVRLALTGTILLALIGAGIYVSEQYRTGGNPDSPLAMGKDLRPRVWKKIGEEIRAPLERCRIGPGVASKYSSVAFSRGRGVLAPPQSRPQLRASADVPGMVAVLALFAALAWRFGSWRCAEGVSRADRLQGRRWLRAYSLGI